MAQSHSVLEKVKPYTKSDFTRLEALAKLLQLIKIDNIAGDVVEVGVWRGGNIMLARMLAPTRTCWLYDTFDGMTMPEDIDTKHSGEPAIDRYNTKTADGRKWDAVSLKDVKEGFEKTGLGLEKLEFVVGDVEQTLMKFGIGPPSIAILRLDVDWYKSTRIAMNQLYPMLSPGGFLVVDDYGHWMGCKLAVDEYFGKSAPPFRDVDYSCRIYFK